jgi:Domain of unknown function (DUF1963)
MVKKYTITFQDADSAITASVTKFGGQPTWLAEPQWPLSRATGERMRFICQIALDEMLFGTLAGRMAYLFLSDGETFVDNTYDPDGGENALIIQPAGTCDIETQPLPTGPALERWIDDVADQRRNPVPCELAVTLQPGEDPDTLDEDEYAQSDEAENTFSALLSENKIGGTPAFLQGPAYPAGGPWKLLLQFDSCSVPFEVNFGDAGIGYGFISEDGKVGKFLWQCA